MRQNDIRTPTQRPALPDTCRLEPCPASLQKRAEPFLRYPAGEQQCKLGSLQCISPARSNQPTCHIQCEGAPRTDPSLDILRGRFADWNEIVGQSLLDQIARMEPRPPPEENTQRVLAAPPDHRRKSLRRRQIDGGVGADSDPIGKERDRRRSSTERPAAERDRQVAPAYVPLEVGFAELGGPGDADGDHRKIDITLSNIPFSCCSNCSISPASNHEPPHEAHLSILIP